MTSDYTPDILSACHCSSPLSTPSTRNCATVWYPTRVAPISETLRVIPSKKYQRGSVHMAKGVINGNGEADKGDVFRTPRIGTAMKLNLALQVTHEPWEMSPRWPA